MKSGNRDISIFAAHLFTIKAIPMKRNVFVFGLLSGLVVAIVMILSSVLCYQNPGFEGGMFLGYAGMLIAFSFIFVGVKNLRDKQEGGVISFGRAFKTGLLIMLIASTIYVAIWLVEYYVFMPDFMERYADHTLSRAQAAGADAVEMSKKTAEMNQYKKMYKNPLFVILFTYAEIVPVGFIVSLICALILKRKPKEPQAAL